MKLLGQAEPAPPPEIRVAEDVPLYAFDFDLTQKQGITFVGDPDYVIREIRAQMRELGAGTLMALFQFGSLPHALACKNSKLFAERVLPELKRA
jgi:alkanesulfonate monooxygenase SsuD/methylene tetrahydromethanopterin reductase-like flavin-dependent oxidoreductase (luciferase family)